MSSFSGNNTNKEEPNPNSSKHFHLETSIRMLIQDIVEPVLKKTQECVRLVENFSQTLEENNKKFEACYDVYETLSERTKVRFSDIDTLLVKVSNIESDLILQNGVTRQDLKELRQEVVEIKDNISYKSDQITYLTTMNEKMNLSIVKMNSTILDTRGDYMEKINDIIKNHFSGFSSIAKDFSKIREEFTLVSKGVDHQKHVFDELSSGIDLQRTERQDTKKKIEALQLLDEERISRQEFTNYMTKMDRALAKKATDQQSTFNTQITNLQKSLDAAKNMINSNRETFETQQSEISNLLQTLTEDRTKDQATLAELVENVGSNSQGMESQYSQMEELKVFVQTQQESFSEMSVAAKRERIKVEAIVEKIEEDIQQLELNTIQQIHAFQSEIKLDVQTQLMAAAQEQKQRSIQEREEFMQLANKRNQEEQQQQQQQQQTQRHQRQQKKQQQSLQQSQQLQQHQSQSEQQQQQQPQQQQQQQQQQLQSQQIEHDQHHQQQQQQSSQHPQQQNQQISQSSHLQIQLPSEQQSQTIITRSNMIDSRTILLPASSDHPSPTGFQAHMAQSLDPTHLFRLNLFQQQSNQLSGLSPLAAFDRNSAKINSKIEEIVSQKIRDYMSQSYRDRVSDSDSSSGNEGDSPRHKGIIRSTDDKHRVKSFSKAISTKKENKIKEEQINLKSLKPTQIQPQSLVNNSISIKNTTNTATATPTRNNEPTSEIKKTEIIELISSAKKEVLDQVKQETKHLKTSEKTVDTVKKEISKMESLSKQMSTSLQEMKSGYATAMSELEKITYRITTAQSDMTIEREFLSSQMRKINKDKENISKTLRHLCMFMPTLVESLNVSLALQIINELQRKEVYESADSVAQSLPLKFYSPIDGTIFELSTEILHAHPCKALYRQQLYERLDLLKNCLAAVITSWENVTSHNPDDLSSNALGKVFSTVIQPKYQQETYVRSATSQIYPQLQQNSAYLNPNLYNSVQLTPQSQQIISPLSLVGSNSQPRMTLKSARKVSVDSDISANLLGFPQHAMTCNTELVQPSQALSQLIEIHAKNTDKLTTASGSKTQRNQSAGISHRKVLKSLKQFNTTHLINIQKSLTKSANNNSEKQKRRDLSQQSTEIHKLNLTFSSINSDQSRSQQFQGL